MIHMHISNHIHRVVSGWGDDLVGNGAKTACKWCRRNCGKATVDSVPFCDFSMQRDITLR